MTQHSDHLHFQTDVSVKYRCRRCNIIIAISIFMSVVLTFCVFLLVFSSNTFSSAKSRTTIVCNDEYISGDFVSKPGGEIAKSFFPEYDSIKDIADIEYMYLSLADDVKLSKIDNSRAYRSIFILELRVHSEKDYIDIRNRTIEDNLIDRIESDDPDSDLYISNSSRYTNFPNNVACVTLSDYYQIITYMFLVDTTYVDRGDAWEGLVLADLPSSMEFDYLSPWRYSKSDYKITQLKCKIPTGSKVLGTCRLEDEDEYGRMLFETDITGELLSDCSNGEVTAYMICQKYDDQSVWFYDDECLILLGDYSRDQMEAFKNANDWGKPINEEKCTSRPILESPLDEPVSFDKAAMESCLSDFLGTDSFVYDVCDQDADGKILVYARSKVYAKDNLQLGKPIVAIVTQNENGSYKISEDGSAQMQDMLDTETAAALKKAVGWNSP